MKHQRFLKPLITGLASLLLLFSMLPNYVHAKKHRKLRAVEKNIAEEDTVRSQIKNRLKFETLTGGQWVPLHSSGSIIESTNQPLKISYISLKRPIKRVAITLQLEKYLDNLVLKSENIKSRASAFKPKQYDLPKTSYKLNDLSSVVIPRLNSGVYSIQIKELNGENSLMWLKVSASSPEPPILCSIDERLAKEDGILSLKFKNVVVRDQIKLFVNGQPAGQKVIAKELDLNSVHRFGKVLPPGKSTITAYLSRNKKISGYSSPIEAVSRTTVLLHRTVDFNRDEFTNNTTTTSENSQRKLDNKFDFLNNTGSAPTSSTEFTSVEAELKKIKKCLQFQNSGWDKAPTFVWPNKETVAASHKLITPKSPIIDVGMKVFPKKISDKIVEDFNKSQEFTLDITFQAMDPAKATTQLRRIISLSKSTGERNFTLGQFDTHLVFRFRAANNHPQNNNGMSVTHNGNQGIHFYDALKKDEIYNVVISYEGQKLRFWVNHKEVPVPKAKYAPKSIIWSKDCHLILGNELGQPYGQNDRLWKGKLHSFSIRDTGVTLPKPDSECMEFLSTIQTTSTPSAAKAGSAATVAASQNTTSKPSQNPTSDSESKISIKEFAFPHPASFPISRFHPSGNTIETEGVVLDQMHLAIAKDGRFKLNFEAQTTMRAEINLQLMVKLDGEGWFPITLPKQTITPSERNRFNLTSITSTKPHAFTVTGYSAIFVNRRDDITEIRRRGSAVFGTRPY
ncbi:hypothetical protein [Gimesia aquarii]|uniref:Uncharacterized protein n=1 Tax=Gimesia aquarii TaxID=2527964 RepID=A0A517WTV2_9PLAN|nr:hypothetical protein [Gimesia aquarii]QDU08676.1 hypothetical protein V202x_20460 [Gimesia aquarii]